MTREEAIVHIKDVICENNAIKPNMVIFEQEKEALYMAIKALEQESCNECKYKTFTELYFHTDPEMVEQDAISRKKAIDVIDALYLDGDSSTSYRAFSEGDTLIGKYQAITALDDLPPIVPQLRTERCKDCKWWKDSDGTFRRGIRAESLCPINRKEVFEGNGYCYMFEPQERSEE